MIYVSRDAAGCGVVSWVGGVTSKLSGFCGIIHGGGGSWFGVALCCSFL